nr:putative polyprotein [Icha Creek insect virus]
MCLMIPQLTFVFCFVIFAALLPEYRYKIALKNRKREVFDDSGKDPGKGLFQDFPQEMIKHFETVITPCFTVANFPVTAVANLVSASTTMLYVFGQIIRTWSKSKELKHWLGAFGLSLIQFVLNLLMIINVEIEPEEVTEIKKALEQTSNLVTDPFPKTTYASKEEFLNHYHVAGKDVSLPLNSPALLQRALNGQTGRRNFRPCFATYSDEVLALYWQQPVEVVKRFRKAVKECVNLRDDPKPVKSVVDEAYVKNVYQNIRQRVDDYQGVGKDPIYQAIISELGTIIYFLVTVKHESKENAKLLKQYQEVEEDLLSFTATNVETYALGTQGLPPKEYTEHLNDTEIATLKQWIRGQHVGKMVREDWFNDSVVPLVKKVISMIVGIITSILFAKATGSKLSSREIVSGISIGKSLADVGNDIEKVICGKFEDKSEAEAKEQEGKDLITKYCNVCNEISETPPHVFEKQPHKIETIKGQLNEVLNFLNEQPKDQQSNLIALRGLYQAANIFKNQLLTNKMPSFVRQEPFIVCLSGPSGIGKSQLANYLIKFIDTSVLRQIEGLNNVISINSQDKYFPPLSGQRIAFFDEAGTVKDFSKDLLFGNIKGICSRNFFNAAAADIIHKTNPTYFEVIIAATNTTPDDLVKRYGAITDSSSIPAMYRRMIFINVSHVNENFDPTRCSEQDYKSDFSHLRLNKINLDIGSNKVSLGNYVSIAALKDMIVDRYGKAATEFDQNCLNSMIKESNTNVQHFSVVMHGAGGHGKTPLIGQISNNLSKVLRLPILKLFSENDINNLKTQNSRSIVVLDDVIKIGSDLSLEKSLMDLYNNKLYPNSIILSATNLSPKYSAFKFTTKGILLLKNHPFVNIGVTRRLGFMGAFTDGYTPNYNLDYKVVKSKLIPERDFIIPYYYFLPILATIIDYRIIVPSIILVCALISCINHFTKFKHSICSGDIEKVVLKSYQNFNELHTGLKTIYDQELTGDFNMILMAERASDIKITTNPFDYIDNVFYSKEKFDNSNPGWKFFLDYNLYKKMYDHSENFLINIDEFNTDTIFSLVQQYAMEFAKLGIPARFKVHVGDLGKFYLENNNFYINLNTHTNSNITVHQDRILHYSDNVVTECLFTDVMDYATWVSTNKLNYATAREISTFIDSIQFAQNPHFIAFIKNYRRQKMNDQLLARGIEVKQTIEGFLSGPYGKIVKVLAAILASIAVITAIVAIVKYFNEDNEKEAIGDRKRRPKKKVIHSDTEEEEAVGDRKRKPKRKVIHSGSEDEEAVGDRKKKRGTKVVHSDDDSPVRQLKVIGREREDVLTLTDMNGFDSYVPIIKNSWTKTRKNMTMVYMSNAKDDILTKEPAGKQACYGIMINDKLMVTVGHTYETWKQSGMSLHMGADELNNKFYKMRPVQHYKHRDISVWTPIPKESLPFKSIANLFKPRKEVVQWHELSAFFQRFGSNKKEEFARGPLAIQTDPTSDGFGGVISDFGEMSFGTFGTKATTYGDCGLPYFSAEPHFNDFILGIHCMGNVEGNYTTSIAALLYEEDIRAWSKINLKEERKVCCDFAADDTYIQIPTVKKCPDQFNVFSSQHNSSNRTFSEELAAGLEFQPGFNGVILKNSGQIAYGSVKHSHTQFLPDETISFNKEPGFKGSMTFGEYGEDSSHIPPNTKVVVTRKNIELVNMPSFIKKIKTSNFRLRINCLSGEKMMKFEIELIEFPVTKLESYKREVVFHQFNDKKEAYVCEELKEILVEAKANLENQGKLPDIPFVQDENNDTINVIGVLPYNASRPPGDQYSLVPYSSELSKIIPITKVPFNKNSELAPAEQKEKMALNTWGLLCPRTTQALQWAHKHYSPASDIRNYVKEQMYSKAKAYYADMKVCNDEFVFKGYPITHRFREGMKGLELDSSIGFSLKSLFCVNRKSDVITCNESGEYFWKDNEASLYTQNLFKEYKELSDQGKDYTVCFNELLKMEKLPPHKNFLGRTFQVQDLIGVMMERRNLGEFSARAMILDPTCGVGTNAYSDFHKIYLRLRKHPNLFTGDYKRFDKTVPMVAFEDMIKILVRVNPYIQNQITSTIKAIYNRIYVSGSTVATAVGGMPSGCVITATGNCFINEYLIYTCFVLLGNVAQFDVSWKSYNRHVERVFYGDDVIVSCSDDVAKFFDRITLSQQMLETFGMVLDSSQKDGTVVRFETFEQASWISRYFRKLKHYPFFVGALKKESIFAYFHYVSETTPSHIGDLLTTAQFESALWDDDTFEKVQEGIKFVLEKNPNILKHNYFQYRSQHDIEREVVKMTTKSLHPEIATPEVPEIPIKDPNCLTKSIIDFGVVAGSQNFFERKHNRSYYRHIIRFIKAYKGNDADERLEQRDKIWTDKQTNVDYRMSHSNVGKLNELFQSGRITKPNYSFEQKEFWHCTVTCCYDSRRICCEGRGNSKAEAKEGAAFSALQQIPITSSRTETNTDSDQNDGRTSNQPIPAIRKKIVLQGREKEINPPRSTLSGSSYDNFYNPSSSRSDVHYPTVITPSIERSVRSNDFQRDLFNAVEQERALRERNQSKRRRIDLDGRYQKEMMLTPHMGVTTGQISSLDPTVVPQQIQATNTTFPTSVPDFNPGAVAINNPAGTGAPFDKKESVYNIFQEWESKNTSVNGTVPRGAIVCRISLDPQYYPRKILEYILFHQQIIPEIEVGLAIGGAAGTISWLRIGWVQDAAKEKITLDEIQQISMQQINMNGSTMTTFPLRDAMRRSFWRSVKNDPDPYPGIVIMVAHPATNVQRNDDVDYPIQVFMRLGPGCQLMAPLNDLTTGDDSTAIDLEPLLGGVKPDLVETVQAQPQLVKTVEFPDCGFHTGTFQPIFRTANIHAMNALECHFTSNVLENVTQENVDSAPEGSLKGFQHVWQIIFSYGTVPDQDFNHLSHDNASLNIPASQATEFVSDITMGSIIYQNTQLWVYPNGISLKFNSLPKDFANGIRGIPSVRFSDLNIGAWPRAEEWVPQNVDIYCWTGSEWGRHVGGTSYVPNNNTGNQFTLTCPTTDMPVTDIPNYVFTGNSFPFISLPDGLKAFYIARSGQTTSVDSPINVVAARGINNVFDKLDRVAQDYQVTWLKMNLIVDDNIIGQLAYANRTFICRTNDVLRVRASLTTAMSLTNIEPVDNPNTITPMNTNTWSPFKQVPTTLSLVLPKAAIKRLPEETFRRKIAIAGKYQRESAIVAGLGGAMTGLDNYLSQQRNFTQQKDLVNLQGDNQIRVLQARYAQQKDYQAYLNHLLLTRLGYSSPGAQMGNIDSLQHPETPAVEKEINNSENSIQLPNYFRPEFRKPLYAPFFKSAGIQNPSKINPIPSQGENPVPKNVITTEAEIHTETKPRMSGPESTLNPEAKEFTPKINSTLNPEAAEFKPSALMATDSALNLFLG